MSVAVLSHRPDVFVQISDLNDVFGPGGSLARALKGFVPRRQQLHMAERVADALEQRRLLVIEAGTGTGKTFGYLVPVLLLGPAGAGLHRHPHPAGSALRQGPAAAQRGAGPAGARGGPEGPRQLSVPASPGRRRNCSRACAAAACWPTPPPGWPTGSSPGPAAPAAVICPRCRTSPTRIRCGRRSPPRATTAWGQRCPEYRPLSPGEGAARGAGGAGGDRQPSPAAGGSDAQGRWLRGCARHGRCRGGR